MKNPQQGSKETLIAQHMKAQDPIELPMDDLFFDKLHDNIMKNVEKTEVKPAKRWTKTWVFLERKAKYYRPANNIQSLRVVKMALAGVTLTLGVGLSAGSYILFNMSSQARIVSNKQAIVKEAAVNPEGWIELAASLQNDTDFYADVVNQKLVRGHGVDLKL